MGHSGHVVSLDVITYNSRPAGVPQRAVVHVGPRWTVKRYQQRRDARAEALWYERVPWAAPHPVHVDGPDLIIPTLPVAALVPGWQPAQELHGLLVRLSQEGIHHRDVHTKNVVMGPDGSPLLIDWETAVMEPSSVSYDLYGPEASGVPVPKLHQKLGVAAQWWGCGQPFSIGREWGVDVPCL